MMEKVKAMSAGERAVDKRDVRLDALHRAEYIGMVRLAYTLASDNAEAEDLVQESFVDVYRCLADIRSPGAYLRTAVLNRCRSVLRHRRVMSLHPPEPPIGLTDTAAELWDVLEILPEAQRIAIVLRYYGNYRASEIAHIVDLPPATVRSQIRRGLKKLRKELKS